MIIMRKFIYKFMAVVLLAGSTSCEMFELDLLDNPNSVTAEQADVTAVYNNIQLTFNGFFNQTWGLTAPLSRQIVGVWYSYSGSYQAVSYNGIWQTAYSQLFPDIELLEQLGAERGLDVHIGTAKVMKAYVLLTLVDLFGDIPFSEAGKGAEIISPVSDPGQSVYSAAEAMLDEAIAQLEAGKDGILPDIEIFYGANPTKWITLAKTLKLKMYLTTRLVDGSAADKINALVSAGDLIDDESEDFQWTYGTNRTNPGTRHPFYYNQYEIGDGVYMNNWYMWIMLEEKGFKDPRTDFYFYRQDIDLSDESDNVWSCHLSDLPDPAETPDHYLEVDPNMPYCIARIDGYFGRDHANGQGIPPDGFIRTVYGLYPGGGKFDDGLGGEVKNAGTDGAVGQGIGPILLSSYVDFMRAEAALTLGTSDDAKEMFLSGVQKSMDKVTAWKSLVDGSKLVATVPQEVTLQEAFFDDLDDRVAAYVDTVGIMWDNTANDEEKLDMIIKEYFIALWGNGIEAYNAYRRTGKPLNIQPTIDPSGDDQGFYRSALLPALHVNQNQNASQKEFSTPVFWDTNPASMFR